MITLRKASIQDLELLEHWDAQEHVIAADPNDDWNWQVELYKDPGWREHLIAELDGNPIGFLQIIDPAEEESHYWGQIGHNKRALDIWIGEKENLGKGYGTKMMALALERCFANPEVTEVLIDPLESNLKAIAFYRRMGFQFLEKRRFGTDTCHVYGITRSIWIGKHGPLI